MTAQFFIAIFGAIAVWLSQDYRHYRKRWACWFGLAGQPFWFYETFTREQWGIFLLSIVFTLAWLRGVKTYWLPRPA